MGDPIIVVPQQSSTDWVRDQIEVRAPAKAVGVHIWRQIIADGRAWFDDVRWQEKGTGSGGLWWGVAVVVAVFIVRVPVLIVLIDRRRRAASETGTGLD